MTEKLLAPAYGDDDASVYAYTEPIVASLMGTRAIPLTPTTAAFSGSVSVASLTASGGISGGSGAFTSNVTVGGTLGVTGNAALGGTLDLTGAATLHSTLGVTGLATLASASLSGALGVTGLSTLTGGFAAGAASSITGTLTTTGDLLAQDATPTVAFQVHVATGAQYARIGSSGTPLLLGDIQNNRVTIGQGTDPAVTNERLSVLGGPLVAGYDNDQSFFLKRASTAGFFTFGTSAGANPGLVVKDTSGTQILFLAPVSGGQGLIVGTDTTFAASENFKVMGGSRLQGALLVTTGGADVTGTSFFRGATTVTTGGFTVTAGGVTISASGLSVTGSSVFNNGITIFESGGVALTLAGSGNQLAFSGSSQTVSTVTGGSATALPAQPVAYIKVAIGGNNYAIPYYNQ